METFKIRNHLIILSVLLTFLSSQFTALPSLPEDASDDQQGLAFPSSPSPFGGPVLSNNPPLGMPLNNQAQQPQVGYQQQQRPSNSQQGLNQPFSSLNPQFGASGANQKGLFTGTIPFATTSGASINNPFVQLVLVSLVTLMMMMSTAIY